MLINKIGINYNNINFKANHFCIGRTGTALYLYSIRTDNEENLGKNPVLKQFYKDLSQTSFESKTEYNGKYYSAFFNSSCYDGYKFYYPDTGKYEKNGELQHVENVDKMIKTAMIEDRKQNSLPLEYGIAKGDTVGQIVTNPSDIPRDVPVILMLDELKNNNMKLLTLPENIKGIITSYSDAWTLGHYANTLRNKFDLVSVVLEDEKFEELKKLDGKLVSLNNENDILEYNILDKLPTVVPRIIPKTKIPQLENIERLLDFSELTPQNCGNKGYRLALMQKLVEEGVLKDITIPEGFVIPEGYINKIKELLNVKDNEEYLKLKENNIYTQEIFDKIKKDIGSDEIMIRSNFNTEDLRSFPSAGMYDSILISLKYYSLAERILDVVNSHIKPLTVPSFDLKLYKQERRALYEKYGIDETKVQPSVIVQKFIGPDYKFTMYSEDNNGNVVIELNDSKGIYIQNRPSTIHYNKKTKELSIKESYPLSMNYWFNEQANLVETEQIEEYGDIIRKNWETLKPLLGIAVAGAIALEKFFKFPQDIEGVIQNGKVFFVQSRDIVAGVAKRI